MRLTRSIAFGVCLGMIPILANAQTPIEAGLIPNELVVAGFTSVHAQRVVNRIDDEDVTDARIGVEYSRTALSHAQSECLRTRLALQKDPANPALRRAEAAAEAELQTARAAAASAVAAYEALLFDRVPGALVTELASVRAQRLLSLAPEMSALNLSQDAQGALAAALIEERRCARRGDEVSDASASLLRSARGDSHVTTAVARLQANLSAVTAILEHTG